MRRWNGWGDDQVEYPVPAGVANFLAQLIGPGLLLEDATLEAVLATVPAGRLPEHPLVDNSPLDRLRHARGQSLPDWVALRSGQIPVFPDGVAYPGRDEDVKNLLRFAAEVGAKVIPYGGGTSVVGHINAPTGDFPVLVVDMRRLNRLRRFDETSHLATFGAGVAGPDLEAQLRARGFTLGHFPQSFEWSTLGGWVATRSSGQQSLGYGRIEKLFAGGRLESPAGTLLLPATIPASAAGPDLRQLVLGSEGRLGILCEATVRVSPLPEYEDFQAIFFPDFDSGREATRQMVQAHIPLALLRLSTAAETQILLRLAGHEFLLGALERLLRVRGLGEQKALLLIGFSGRESLVRAARREAFHLARQQGGVQVGRTFGKQWHKNRFRTPYLRNTLWTMGYAVDTLETATDWGNTPTMLTTIETALSHSLPDEKVHVFSHLSHFYPYGSSIYTTYIFRRASDPEQTLARWQQLKSAASQAIVDQGGTISHQHGVGSDHAPYLVAEKGTLGLGLIGAMAKELDPAGMMNPNKLIIGYGHGT